MKKAVVSKREDRGCFIPGLENPGQKELYDDGCNLQPDSYAGHSFSPLSESAVVKVFGLVKNQKTSITPGYFTPFSISGLSLPS